jgi:hypothetical protein
MAEAEQDGQIIAKTTINRCQALTFDYKIKKGFSCNSKGL